MNTTYGLEIRGEKLV